MKPSSDLPVPLQLCTYRLSDRNDASTLARSLEGQDVPHCRRLISDLSYHSLLPLAHLALEDLEEMGLGASIPALLRTDCSVAFHQEVVRTTLIDHQCRLLLHDCARGGVLPMPLKGNYLSSLVYSRKEARPYRDIDLLVREEDLPLVADILRQSGYRPRPGMVEFQPPPYSTSYVRNLEGDRLKVDLDLHTSIHWPPEYFARTRFDIGDVWSHAMDVAYDGTPALAMSPEHQVVYTCTDMAVNHRFAHLLKFRDLFEMFSRYPVDIEEVAFWARRWRLRSFVYPALSLFRHSGGEHLLPANLPHGLRPRYPLFNLYLQMIKAPGLPSRRSREISPSNLVFLLLADDLAGRLNGLANLPRHFYGKLKFPSLQ